MEEKKYIKYNIFKLAIFTVIAVMVFAFRIALVEHINYFIGGLMLLYAFEELLFILLHHIHHILHEDKFYLGCIEALLGMTLILVNMSYESVCVIWATWSILRESYEIKEIE